MAFNASNYTQRNLTTFVDLFEQANEITSGSSETHFFGDSIILVIFAIVMAICIGNPTYRLEGLKAMMVASLMAFISAVFLDMVHLVDPWIITLSLALLAISIIADYFGEKRD